ncbi:hypothetical protein FB45DRAFT_1128455 [Roridomyces roridus]|uniref:Uncharacterized protein n=1 Tax=Roridomyces roridus TaxID=1738132 RepID=A0AAD7F8G8_9AGAR|nr:hypothetical protein FB45DRAFT_1128455 [Roridomyces roridus]
MGVSHSSFGCAECHGPNLCYMQTSQPIHNVIEHEDYKERMSDWAAKLTSLYPYEYIDTNPEFTKSRGLAKPTHFYVRPTPYPVTQAEWERYLAAMERRQRDLQERKITKVHHYRRSGQLGHECIILYIQSAQDTRLARLDRLNLESELFRVSPRYWIGELINTKEYRLIRTLDVPPTAHFTLVECAAIASSIAVARKDYSSFDHMCMWYAAVLFNAVRRRFPQAKIVPGPFLNEAGKVFGHQFVDADATLTATMWINGEESLVLVTAEEEGTVPAFRDAFRSDLEKLDDPCLKLDEIVENSRVKEEELLDGMENQLQSTREAIAEIVQRKANVAEIAELERRIAIAQSKLDAALATTAEMEREIASQKASTAL